MYSLDRPRLVVNVLDFLLRYFASEKSAHVAHVDDGEPTEQLVKTVNAQDGTLPSSVAYIPFGTSGVSANAKERIYHGPVSACGALAGTRAIPTIHQTKQQRRGRNIGALKVSVCVWRSDTAIWGKQLVAAAKATALPIAGTGGSTIERVRKEGRAGKRADRRYESVKPRVLR